jgi:hypothetical protein
MMNSLIFWREICTMVDKVERKAKIFHHPRVGIADLKDLITVEATEEAAVVEVTNIRDANEHN